jgi:transposase
VQRDCLTAAEYLLREQVKQLEPWLQQCAEWKQSGISELVGFARGLRADEAAVRAALRYAWSQGPIAGQVNCLTLLKRQMYGRAKFDLLRQRVLFRPAG